MRGQDLKPPELQGSTFTGPTFGALGPRQGVPVINIPKPPILASDRSNACGVVDGERSRTDDEADAAPSITASPTAPGGLPSSVAQWI